jgi:hypothetical protein
MKSFILKRHTPVVALVAIVLNLCLTTAIGGGHDVSTLV